MPGEVLNLFDCYIPPMSADDRKVLSILRGHDRSNPIARTELAELVGISGREIQDVVRRLIMDYGQLIGSSTDARNPGYYMIADIKEADKVCHSLRRRALKILVRVAKIRKISVRELLEQMKMELNLDE